MSELRFACPSCSQIVECEKAYGGHVIHCPNCCAEIRIPFSNTALPSEMDVPKAQLVLEPPAGTKPSVPNVPNVNREFICPVCQSELRAPPAGANPPSAGGPPIADLVHRAPPPADRPVKEEKPDLPKADTHKSHTEHEQELAAARAAHPVQSYPTTKPRLAYILGEQPPTPTKDSPSPPPDDGKSFSE